MDLARHEIRSVADTNTKNAQSRLTTLQFVYADATARIKPRDKRNIKSHAARGTGRPRQGKLKRPRAGTWIRDEPDKPKPGMHIVRRMMIPESLSIFPGLSGLWIDKIVKCEREVRASKLSIIEPLTFLQASASCRKHSIRQHSVQYSTFLIRLGLCT